MFNYDEFYDEYDEYDEYYDSQPSKVKIKTKNKYSSEDDFRKSSKKKKKDYKKYQREKEKMKLEAVNQLNDDTEEDEY